LGTPPRQNRNDFVWAEQGDYIRESVAFTVADEYNTLMQPQTDEPPTNQSTPTPGWQFTPDGAAKAPENQPTPAMAGPTSPEIAPKPRIAEAGSVSWSASEFIVHEKKTGWYGLLALAGIFIAAAVYLLTKDKISSIMIMFATLILGVFAARRPRTLDYQVDSSGIHIGPKSYPYEDFKSFSVIDEGAISSINLTPLKRFMAGITVYYDPKDEDRIVTVLSDYLPFEEGKKDVVDRFMHRIRF